MKTKTAVRVIEMLDEQLRAREKIVSAANQRCDQSIEHNQKIIKEYEAIITQVARNFGLDTEGSIWWTSIPAQTIRKYEAMAEARDRFCHAINQVAITLGMEGKDHFDPSAIMRKAISVVEDAKAWRHVIEELASITGVPQSVSSDPKVLCPIIRKRIEEMHSKYVQEQLNRQEAEQTVTDLGAAMSRALGIPENSHYEEILAAVGMLRMRLEQSSGILQRPRGASDVLADARDKILEMDAPSREVQCPQCNKIMLSNKENVICSCGCSFKV